MNVSCSYLRVINLVHGKHLWKGFNYQRLQFLSKWSNNACCCEGAQTPYIELYTPALARQTNAHLSSSKGSALTLWCEAPKSCSPRLAGPGQASSSIQLSQQNLKRINYPLQYYINWPITLIDRYFHPTRVAYIHCLSSGFYWKKFML